MMFKNSDLPLAELSSDIKEVRFMSVLNKLLLHDVNFALINSVCQGPFSQWKAQPLNQVHSLASILFDEHFAYGCYSQK